MPPELIWHTDPFPWKPFLMAMAIILCAVCIVVYVAEAIHKREEDE